MNNGRAKIDPNLKLISMHEVGANLKLVKQKGRALSVTFNLMKNIKRYVCLANEVI